MRSWINALQDLGRLTLVWALIYCSPAAADFKPRLDDLDAMPMHALPVTAVQKALTAVPPRKNGQPLQFAVGIPFTMALTEGRWDTLDPQTLSWRTRIYSAGALSLNLEFARFHMPEGGSLWLYDPIGRIVQGPYTGKNHSPEGKLWTAVVPGEEVVLEVRVPADAKDRLRLEVGQVNHGFVDFTKAGTVEPKSGSCNVDVVCPQGDAWRSEIRSVARITIGGQFLCSGQLVNNIRQDFKPFFLTANHCGIGDPGNSPSSVVFYWNYQTSTCGDSPNGSLLQNQTGSAFIADDEGSDFNLVRLNQCPNPAFNVYYAGWNAENPVPQSGVGIHHPTGDEKRISVYNSPATRDQVDIGVIVETWKVIWAEGVTEPGSSGSGLWDQSHRLVGTLTGGDSSCSTPAGPDYYGRTEVAWATQPASNRQLKAHLDPDSTGTLTLDGLDSASHHSPSAASDSFTVAEDSTTDFNVLSNDSNPDGRTLVVTAVGTPNRGGTAAILSGGALIRYTPAANFFGAESFTYTLSDGTVCQGTATATVSVSVTSVNDAPNAVNDSFSVTQNSSSNSLNVLANDTDPDSGDSLTITAVGTPTQGGSVVISGSTLTYSPAAGFAGTETFTYTIRDTAGLTGSATVTMTVSAPPSSGGGGGGGGGGSLSLSLLALLGLAASARRSLHAVHSTFQQRR